MKVKTTIKQLRFFNFCPILRKMLETHQTIGRSGKIHKGLTSLSSIHTLIIIRNIFFQICPEHTLEIGFAYGGSTLVMASSHRDLGRQPAKQHTAIDPGQAFTWDDAGLLNINRAGLKGFLDFRQLYSCQALPNLLEEKRNFDFVYIDGSHLFEDVFIDFYYVNLLLSDNGIVLFDDCTTPDIKKLLRFIDRNFSLTYSKINLTTFRLDSDKSLKYQFAKITNRTQSTAYQKIGPS